MNAGYYDSSSGDKTNLVLKRGRKNNILPYLAREFRISFNFWLDSNGSDVWQSVLHFAQGGHNPNDVRDYPRMPAVLIGEGNKLTILMQHLTYDSKTPLPTKKYTNIEMLQNFEKGSRNKEERQFEEVFCQAKFVQYLICCVAWWQDGTVAW